MSSLSMRVFGYDLQLELIPANQRMIKHEDYEELAISVMSMVDLLVHKTSERIESATDIPKAILKPIVDGEEEIHWLPRDPEALKLTERYDSKGARRATRRGFLSEVSAQLPQAKEDGDKPGLEAMLLKVLQLYASSILSKRSYANKGEEVLKAGQFLETIIKGGRFIPAMHSDRVSQGHSIKSRRDCPSASGQAMVAQIEF